MLYVYTILAIITITLCLNRVHTCSAFSDGTQKDLLKLIGNLPVKYEGKADRNTHFCHYQNLLSIFYFPGGRDPSSCVTSQCFCLGNSGSFVLLFGGRGFGGVLKCGLLSPLSL